MKERLIGAAGAARIWRVAPATFRAYVHRGYAPLPVAPGLWSETEVREAAKQRPGQGRRTDRWGARDARADRDGPDALA